MFSRGMAKKAKQNTVRLVSQAGTGYFYTIRRTVKAGREKCAARCRTAPAAAAALSMPARVSPNVPRALPTPRLQLLKHDPRVNAHVLFKEERIKK